MGSVYVKDKEKSEPGVASSGCGRRVERRWVLGCSSSSDSADDASLGGGGEIWWRLFGSWFVVVAARLEFVSLLSWWR